ncbi:hypothetical protein MTR_6g049100 [Medicago truncatula]|uniref:Uncharacterized protein n=1 Tax=Medicago truncatula TaxID=3880 RepID=A0A072U903_MEDTR|nr:hypothetical protein MTR_6g049100 [Medicago truncatula]
MAGGIDDAAIAQALATMAQVLAQSNENAVANRRNEGEAEEMRLDRFLRNNPPTLKGRFDPEGAQTWVQGMERIFRAMVTGNDQKAQTSDSYAS